MMVCAHENVSFETVGSSELVWTNGHYDMSAGTEQVLVCEDCDEQLDWDDKYAYLLERDDDYDD